jgi:NAD/NADP transhydrogenase alpha subunit
MPRGPQVNWSPRTPHRVWSCQAKPCGVYSGAMRKIFVVGDVGVQRCGAADRAGALLRSHDALVAVARLAESFKNGGLAASFPNQASDEI